MLVQYKYFFYLFYASKQILKRLRTETLFFIVDSTVLNLKLSAMGRYGVVHQPLNFLAIMSHRFVAKWLISNMIYKQLELTGVRIIMTMYMFSQKGYETVVRQNIQLNVI